MKADRIFKQLTLPVLAVAGSLLFFSPLRSLFDDYVVTPVLSKIRTSYTSDAGVLLLVLFLFTATALVLKSRKQISNRFYLWIAAVSALYLCARIFSNYVFYRFAVIPPRYTDTLLLFFGCATVVRFAGALRRKQTATVTGIPFITDVPITGASQDLLSRQQFARRIAEKIRSSTNTDNTLAVGISGQWGTGKTSFMNLIKEKMQGSGNIVLSFNSWNSAPSRIPTDFFTMLSAAVGPYDEQLKKALSAYAGSITAGSDKLGAVQGIFSKLLDTGEGVYTQDQVNALLRQLKKQVVVFIDDIDRLDTQEIVEVLRLIRNTANFSRMVYVVTYDRGYVEEAIRRYNEHNFSFFLEKIFDVEFALPLHDADVLRSRIEEILCRQLDEKYHEKIRWVIHKGDSSVYHFTDGFLHTMRDVIRLANSFLFDVADVKDEVSLTDFYLLQLVKLKYRVLYDALARDRFRFFRYDENFRNIPVIRLRRHRDISKDSVTVDIEKHFDKKTGDKEEDSSYELWHFLEELVRQNKMTTAGVPLVMALVKILLRERADYFGDGIYDNTELLKRFAHPRNYHKYFSFRLFESDLSEAEFEDYRVRAYEEYALKADEWKNAGLWEPLRSRLKAVTQFYSRDEFENHLRMLFRMGREDFANNRWMYFEYGHVLNVLAYPVGNKTLYEQQEDYKLLLRSIFDEATAPALFDSNIINTAVMQSISFGFLWEEMHGINLDFFKKYCQHVSYLENFFWPMYRNCKIRKDDPYTDAAISGDATRYAQEQFERLVTAYDLGMLIKESSPDSQAFYFEPETCAFIVEKTEAIGEWVSHARGIDKKSDCFKEFMRFFQATKDNAFNPVSFEFTFLSPRRWN